MARSPIIESLLLPYRSLDGTWTKRQDGQRTIYEQTSAKSDPEIAASYVEAARRLCEESPNPVYACAAWRECRAAGLEIPDWVLAYFDFVAENMLDHWCNPPESAAYAAAKVLGIDSDGAGTAFSRAGQVRWMWVGANVERRMKQGTKAEFAISDEAGARGLSVATVRRDWKRYRDTFKN